MNKNSEHATIEQHAERFLDDRDSVRWSAPDGLPTGMSPSGVFAQTTRSGLEVALVTSVSRPAAGAMRKAHKARRAGRASPVLLVALYQNRLGVRVSMCGPAGDAPPVFTDMEVSQIERITRLALGEPTRHAAVRFLTSALPEMFSPMPGLRNVGLLATHELVAGVPQRGDWADAVTRSAPLLDVAGPKLVKRLGFGVEPSGTSASVLTVNGTGRAVAVFCDASEPFDASAQRFGGASPVSHALAVADRHGVDWALLTRGSEIRLYAARLDTGVGRKGRSETFVEANLALLEQQRAGYLRLLFSAEALSPSGTIEEILGDSTRFAADLAVRLRDRVYFKTVPALAAALAKRIAPQPTGVELAAAYEQVMVILFRLLFVAYAEDKDLLPYRSNSLYEARSLKRLAIETAEGHRNDAADYSSESTVLWDRIKDLWAAVGRGRPTWGVPAYNGGLFAEDPSVSPAGAALADMRLTDDELGPALAALLLDDGPEGIGPVDFRSLSVREFGTIYEGLLESRLAVAADDLTVKPQSGGEQYVPARAGDDVHVFAGEVYLEGVSGQRKATGSYFTKPFCVAHLLDEALEPTLRAHLSRLTELRNAGDEAAAAEAFFDFRCADIAMGSGHFLVAALDRIEARLSRWLADNPLPQVTAELDRLRSSALAALGDLAVGLEIESSSLLRRQVARRCVYGVDLNDVAVELARLALWVHTFVPGLPLSFLDHNLVRGDSLTGVGTIDEAMKVLGADSSGLFAGQVQDLLAGASDALARLGRTSDADAAEISEARAAHRAARKAVTGAEAIFDVITADRAGACALPELLEEPTFVQAAASPAAAAAVAELRPLHFPAVFPEVFLRERPGFDCVLGNPPWEQVVVQEHVWWGMHIPRVRGKSVAKMNAEIAKLRRSRLDLEVAYEEAAEQADRMRGVLRAAYPEMGAGRTDFYKAFAWRNWRLVRKDGTAGIVLPRSALLTKGSEQWRKTVLVEGTFRSVVVLLNAGGWVFDDVEDRYEIALVALRRRATSERGLVYGGPFRDRPSYEKHRGNDQSGVSLDEFYSWSDDASFPQLPADDRALSVFRKLRMSPRLDAHGRSVGRTVGRTVGRSDGRTVGRSDGRTDGRTDGPLSSFTSVAAGARYRSRNYTRQQTNIASSSTVESSRDPGRRQRHQRQASSHPRQRKVRPVRELDATNDKHLFTLDSGHSAMSGHSSRWAVYAGSAFNIWQPDTGRHFASVDGDRITAHLQTKRLRQHKTKSSAFSSLPNEVIRDESTLPCYKPRIAFRDIARPDDTRTVLTALIPGQVVLTNKAPYLLFVDGTARDEAYLLGVLSSMILDWYARRLVDKSLNFYLLNNFPIPEHYDDDPVANRVVQITGRLAAVDDRYAEWASEIGVEVGSVTDEETKQDLIYELDACVAHLYGLDGDDLAVIYETFHTGADYSSRHTAVLAHFGNLPKEDSQ